MFNKVQYWFDKGDDYLKTGQYDAAIKYYKKVLEVDINYEKAKEHTLIACKARAQDLFYSQDYTLALKYCEDALQICPTDPDSLIQQQYLLIHLESEIHQIAKNNIAGFSNNITIMADSLSALIAAQEALILKRMALKILSHIENRKINSVTVTIEPIAEMAAFSRDVYFIDPNYDPSSSQVRDNLPDEWTIFDFIHSPISKYTGAAYLKLHPDGHPTFLAIAHKGTNFKNISDLLADIEVMREKPAMLSPLLAKINAAINFHEQVEKRLEERYGKEGLQIPCAMTGHSLGAVFAQLLALNMPAITFENPGAEALTKEFCERVLEWTKEDIEYSLRRMRDTHTTYNAHINAINSCNKPIGQIFKLSNLPYNYEVLNVDATLIINYGLYTLDQHSMQNMKDYLKKNDTVVPAKYPIGLSRGYAAYLNPSRSLYWKGYAQELWKRGSPINHIIFHNFEDFFQYFNEQITKIWESTPNKQAFVHNFGIFKVVINKDKETFTQEISSLARDARLKTM